MESTLTPDEVQSWASYPETLLVLDPGDHEAVVDLRRPLGEQERARLRGVTSGKPFAVVTACNPRGRTVSAAENAARHAALVEQVTNAGLFGGIVHGRSPDGLHEEPGVAVCTQDQAEAVRLAREWEQSALFLFDGQVVWLIGALVAHPAMALPVTQ